MNAAQAYIASLAPGMDIIAGAEALQDNSSPAVRELRRLREVYFGETAFSRKQREAVASAKKTGKTLTAIQIIERRVGGVRNKREQWDLWRELCGLRVSEDELDRIARTKTRRPKSTPTPGVTVRKTPNLWQLKVVGESEDITDMAAALGTTIESAKKFFFGGQAAAQTKKTTNVIITLDELVELVEGRGDDIALRMTNGATTTGARLVQGLLEGIGLATVVHPVHGPVNLYRTARHANWKQRTMAMAESPTCAWPKCRAGAEQCQVHHLHPWKLGGETNAENLTMLCPYHNGVNADNPNAPPKRGRMERRNGTVEWRPPWG